MEGRAKGHILHGSARTTEAVRRAIQHSQASLRDVAADSASIRNRPPRGGAGPLQPMPPEDQPQYSRRFHSTMWTTLQTTTNDRGNLSSIQAGGRPETLPCPSGCFRAPRPRPQPAGPAAGTRLPVPPPAVRPHASRTTMPDMPPMPNGTTCRQASRGATGACCPGRAPEPTRHPLPRWRCPPRPACPTSIADDLEPRP